MSCSDPAGDLNHFSLFHLYDIAIELDRMMQKEQTFIKGECVEAASVKDRENFPNEIE